MPDYDERFLTPTDSRFEALGLPCNLLLFDPTVFVEEPKYTCIVNQYSCPLNIMTNLRSYLVERSPLFSTSFSISLQIARVVKECKEHCLGQGLGAQNYTYLYTMGYGGAHYHFFRDEITGNIVSLIMPSRGETSFLCVEGEKVMALICEGNRPGEKAQAYTGFSMETLLSHIEKGAPLFLSKKSIQIVEVLGEGFESVVLKVRCLASGDMFVLKLGKLRLEENYRALQPMLAAIQATGLSVAQYLLYDTLLNGILMEHLEGDTFSTCIEQMEKKQRSLSELLNIYATCLRTLIALHDPQLFLSHGDAHDENWLVNGDTPVLIDFRYSHTIPFTSDSYRHRDTFAMLCTLYRLLYGKYPRNRQEVKRAIMQQASYRHEGLGDFPQLHQGNRYDELLRHFLHRSVYNPQACTLTAIVRIVDIYVTGFRAARQ